MDQSSETRPQVEASGQPARRPQWLTKDAQILAAAERVFMARGYARASMDAIARTAAVSKQTLYHHYGSKAALFGAIVTARVERLLEPLRSADLGDLPPRAALEQLGREFLEIALSPSSIALHRAIVTEVPHLPDLGRATYEQGPKRVVSVLARYLRQQADRGRLEVGDADRAAEQFLGMMLGHFQLRALYGVAAQPGPDWIKDAVEMFLAAHSPGGAAG